MSCESENGYHVVVGEDKEFGFLGYVDRVSQKRVLSVNLRFMG